jgi:hypothetical protein
VTEDRNALLIKYLSLHIREQKINNLCEINRSQTFKNNYLPLSRPTPQTLMVCMGWVFKTVRFSGSISFKAPSSKSMNKSLPCNSAFRNRACQRNSTYVSPSAHHVQQIIFPHRQINDAFIYSFTAPLRSQVFFGDFHPTQRPHREPDRSLSGFLFRL